MTITFNVSHGKANIGDALKISFEDSLKVELFYSFKPEPLVLNAPAKLGDKVELVLRSYRIELYVNEQLMDEEWCCGEIDLSKEIGGDFEIRLSDNITEHTENELRSGLTIEALRRYGVNVGDCMPFTDDDGVFHIFWLYDRHHHHSKWGLGAHQWAHASSKDLISWDEHPMAVGITDPLEGSICTGSVLHAEDGYRAWYTVRMSDGSPARISCAVSDNDRDYVKTDKYFVLPERYHRPSARDPKAILYDGKYHLLLTTTDLTNGKGCLAHLVSDHPDMSDFKDLGPILTWEDGNQPECPDWFEMDGHYYLVWSIGGKAHYAFSKDPFGECGWTIPENNIIDCGSVPKSALILTDCKYKGERIFVGFIPENGYAGRFILKKTIKAEDGILTFAEL